MRTFNSLFLISILSLGSGITSAAALDRADVEKMESLWSSSFSEDNTGRLMSLYSEDAVMFPPSSEILEGKPKIVAYLEGLKKVGVTKYDISSVDLNVEGNMAYETGLWEATRVDDDGNVIKLDGNITNVLEKQNDGSWKIKLQSWN